MRNNLKRTLKFFLIDLKKGGFTLMEILVVMGILVVVFLLSISVLSSLYKKTELDTAKDNIIALMKAAKNKTLASEQSAKYGIYFDTATDPDRYIFFQGLNYASRNIAFDEIYELPKTVEILSMSLGGSNDEIVFDRLDGNTGNYGNIVIRSLKTDSTRTVYVYSSGEVSDRENIVSGAGLISDSRHIHLDLGWDMSGSTDLKFYFVNAGQTEIVPIADFFSFEEFNWRGQFWVNNEWQRFEIHTHQLIPTTDLCIHRDRNYGENNQEVFIYIIQGGTEKEIIHYDDNQQATATKGNYVLGQMEKQ
jgi:prepilin-type N-terminal cleavage/methylation domain-containing protein